MVIRMTETNTLTLPPELAATLDQLSITKKKNKKLMNNVRMLKDL